MRVWGIYGDIENLNEDTIAKEIAMRQAQIRGIYNGLKYADGGAYSQDLNRIDEIRREIEILKGLSLSSED